MVFTLVSSRKFSITLCILWLLAILCLSLSPSPPDMANSFLGWDKFQHAFAYAMLTFLAIRSLAPSRAAILTAFLLAGSFGLFMELAQGLLTSSRVADRYDLVANLVGSAVVSLVYLWCRQQKRSAKNVLVFIAATHLFMPLDSRCEEHSFNLAGEIRSATDRLSAEAAEIASFPLGIDNNGLLATFLVAGAVFATASFDDDIMNTVASNRGADLDHISHAAEIFGDPFLHLGVAVAVYGGGILGDSRSYRELGEMFGEAALLADAATLILKQSIGRGRPSVTSSTGSFRPFQFSNDYDAMPSMHTASSFAMASVMASAAESSSVAVMSYAAAALVGLSRIYQERHWTSDVLLGAAIGELCGRTVTGYHAAADARRVSIVPALSDRAAVISLSRRF